jgi:L-lactate dehydrogenase complex protein LldG
MNSKELILESIRKHTQTKYEKPELSVDAITYSDKQAKFCEMLQFVGGEFLILKEGEDLNDVIMRLNPEAKRIGSILSYITCNTFNPDELEYSTELNGTDLAVVEGVFGVAENGAVWMDQNVKHKALYFISEKLIIVLDKNKLVNNMHEAYRQMEIGKYGFGVFISGPSKTADIEQALVIGAHGPKGLMVILK